MRQWRLSRIAALLLLSMMLAADVKANKFYVQWASFTQLPMSGTEIQVYLEAEARYIGAVDPGDENWNIEAHMSYDNNNVSGNGNNGSGITANMTISCLRQSWPDPDCAAFAGVGLCDSTGSDNVVTGSGKVWVIHGSTSSEFDEKAAPQLTLTCPNTGDDGSSNEPLDDAQQEDAASPILIDLDRNGFHLSGLSESVFFDINADGVLEELSWTDGNERDGFLVLDVNRNGRIDDGTELFGNHSWLLDGSKSPHGYRALAEYDKEEAGGNADGFIDEGDFVFVMLRVWLDEDHDGIADDVEMLTMEEAGVLKLDLDYRENRSRDPHGNRLRFNSRAWIAHDGSGSLPAKSTDVFFVVKD